jgi:hypothetical protein
MTLIPALRDPLPVYNSALLLPLGLLAAATAGFHVGSLTVTAAFLRGQQSVLRRAAGDDCSAPRMTAAPRRRRPPPPHRRPHGDRPGRWHHAAMAAPVPRVRAPHAHRPPPRPVASVALPPRTKLPDLATPGEARFLRTGPHRYQVSAAIIDTLASELVSPPGDAIKVSGDPITASGRGGAGGAAARPPGRLRLGTLRPHSVWSWVGARSGDTLLAIDGQRLAAGEYRRARQLLRSGFQKRLTLLHHGHPYDVVLQSASGVRRRAPHQYDVSRTLIDRMLERPAQVVEGARLLPWRAPAATDVTDAIARIAGVTGIGGTGGASRRSGGIRVLSVQPNAPLALLGLLPGDVLLRANGQPLSGPEHCLTVYTRVRDSSFVALDILRDGKPLTLEYMIRS